LTEHTTEYSARIHFSRPEKPFHCGRKNRHDIVTALFLDRLRLCGNVFPFLGPLSREEIVEKVMRERYVKPNTILVNLQNPKYFKKTKEGKYVPA
jgi:hypothetical protein